MYMYVVAIVTELSTTCESGMPSDPKVNDVFVIIAVHVYICLYKNMYVHVDRYMYIAVNVYVCLYMYM